MLRIFGFYGVSNSHKAFTSRMAQLFKVKNMFGQFTIFNQGYLFLIHEIFKKKEAENFSFIDKNNKKACFIVGNIYAHDNKSLKILTGENIAKMIISEYNKSSLSFVKYLRGVFNIIIVDKKQIFLINDNMGLSPMYIYRTDNGFFFCSEPEPIIWLNVNNRLDYNAIAKFISYGFVPDGKTFISGLYNQAPGTILNFDGRKISNKKYINFKAMNINNMSERGKIQFTKDIFNEAVQIRINKNHRYIFSELSGGWDTRFIIANLMSLNKKIIAYTVSGNNTDLNIAKKIAKKIKFGHIIQKQSMDMDSNERLFLDLTYRREKTNEFISQHKNTCSLSFNRLVNLEFFISPRFTGLFGTEAFGYIPFWFSRSIKHNFIIRASKIFTRNFLLKALRNEGNIKTLRYFNESDNPIYLFLAHIGRAYLNVHHSLSWAKPPSFFSYRFLHPFADSKFISLLCAFEYEKYMHYNLYEKVFEKYYRSYFDIPWTYKFLRKKDTLRKLSSTNNNTYPLNDRIYHDKKFISFLKQNTIMKKNSEIFSKLKELYFLFGWFNTYKTVLSHSDVHFLAGTIEQGGRGSAGDF
ncbi:MAG: hypothetical protein COV72_06745 [Candidatus Omnitrophica bacterium CG11_big_fil_rev_8_21_14_0_20_42_13]|uniref:asparagine synthase (glutamine-hydrolyzing) n=1 Tax=Candidatus Ghiorseimicrobium undicola TaxID=1974746 RepID=A0A2H0LZ45_9BACT|nr:MAG: hypothetical protein COV72_06745 [Candidatus Omnitrophica bacterium CG11_big_fil_rev_8_21_14_0_20_42_13]